VVDAAVVIVVKLDDVLARLGGHGGRWPVVLRWMTGLMTLAARPPPRTDKQEEHPATRAPLAVRRHRCLVMDAPRSGPFFTR
jgi:hypothetical protein